MTPRGALETRGALACKGRGQGTRHRPGVACRPMQGQRWVASAPKIQHRRAPPLPARGPFRPPPPRVPAPTLRTQPTAKHQRTQSQTRRASEPPRTGGCEPRWRPPAGRPIAEHPSRPRHRRPEKVLPLVLNGRSLHVPSPCYVPVAAFIINGERAQPHSTRAGKGAENKQSPRYTRKTVSRIGDRVCR